ncbi:putative MFS transporter, AGZA family, xanthine/uracil permease [Desulfonispora thiosulfatigenes DSM 11270]|uniref:Putative MFS transporter, AGZA family, xanthine/uracil permease n=1 Tax=Desulfonispora thiosulfatigenes DSM 11270 TaxID=656914 RepID=A0A1W1VDY9_DESTI|nr:NCS2 family permease [Desulfonispora thiosulfatigenes]SMB91592.1 putative MFS transporter, AGZA family, xanthine/uracil permease [Desulfonispora thiosulfatigenes DSM 11270]
MFENLFKLRENGTNVRTEIVAGLTTFMTMAYIIAVNPQILGEAGMPTGSVFVATCLSAAIGCFLMGLLANYPFALAPGMGLNAFFTYYVVMQMGLSWQGALAAVFISGIIFIILTVTKAREAIVNSIPLTLKYAVSVGIGLFIALIGFKNAGIIIHNPSTGSLGLITGEYFTDEALRQLLPFGTSPESILLAVIGLVVTSILVVKKVRGSLLWGILLTTVIGIPLGVVNLGAGFSPISMPPSLSGTFLALDFKEVFSYGLIPVIFAFTFVDLFDTIGTLIGVSSKAGFLDEKGELPKANKALFADSIATLFGAVLGTSTTTTFVESASGVAEGGRTGLTAITTGVLFLLTLFFAPLVGIIPAAATAPILIIVGIFMMEPVTKIDFSDYVEAIPAFFTIFMMPLAYSIAEGIVFGVLAFVILRVSVGKIKEVSLTMWILFLLFIIRFFV